MPVIGPLGSPSTVPGSFGVGGIGSAGAATIPPSPSGTAIDPRFLALYYAPMQRPVMAVRIGGQYRTLDGLPPQPGAQEYKPLRWYSDSSHPYALINCSAGRVSTTVSEDGIRPARAELTLVQRLDEQAVYELGTRGNIPLVVMMGLYDPITRAMILPSVFTGYVRADDQRAWPYTNKLVGAGMLWKMERDAWQATKIQGPMAEWQVLSALYAAAQVKGWDLDGSDLTVLNDKEDPDGDPAPFYNPSGQSPLQIAAELDRAGLYVECDTPEGNIRRRRLSTDGGVTGDYIFAKAGHGERYAAPNLPIKSASLARDQDWCRNAFKVLGKRYLSPGSGDPTRPSRAYRRLNNLVAPSDYILAPVLESEWLDSQELVDDVIGKYSRHRNKLRQTYTVTTLGYPYATCNKIAQVFDPDNGVPVSTQGVVRQVDQSFDENGFLTTWVIDLGFGEEGDPYTIKPHAALDVTATQDGTTGIWTVELDAGGSYDTDGGDPLTAYGLNCEFFNNKNSNTQSGPKTTCTMIMTADEMIGTPPIPDPEFFVVVTDADGLVDDTSVVIPT